MRHENISIQWISTFLNKGKRSVQEDSVLVDREKGIVVVADGFGGPIAGVTASQEACEAVKTFLFKGARDRDATLPFELRTYFSLAGNVLFNSLIFANRKLMNLNRGKTVHEKGGASVIAGYIDGDLLAIANVGSCTAHIYRGGEHTSLVLPRTWSSLCDPFLKSHSDDFHIPLMALGIVNDLEPEILEYRLKKGDWITFETDGLPFDTPSEIAAIQRKNLSPEQSAEQVSLFMKQHDFEDNAAVSLMIL